MMREQKYDSPDEQWLRVSVLIRPPPAALLFEVEVSTPYWYWYWYWYKVARADSVN